MMHWKLLLALSTIGLLAACETTEGGSSDGTVDDTDTTDDTDSPVPDGDAWSTTESPCFGSGVSALHCDDDQTCYVGCGETADGTGLHLTTDGGATWGTPTDSAGGFFADYRVMSLTREGSLLYVAGTSTNSSHRVVSLDTTSGSLSEIYMNGSNIDYSLTAGSYARTSDGTEVAESLTGTGIVIRKDNSDWQTTYTENDGWASGYGWWNSTNYSSNVQVLNMTVVDDMILGVGAQINEVPVVYLPPRSWDFGTDADQDADGYVEQLWETVSLADGFSLYDGECWDIAGNEDGLAVVCVDQDADRGMVYTIGSDWAITAYETENWTATNAGEIVEAGTVRGHSTWNEGVCRGAGNDITVVGRDSQDDLGYAMRSSDGGTTWTELTQGILAAHGGDFGPLNRCQYVGDSLIVGGSGIMASVKLSDI